MERENFQSRLGFILVSAGCAIGKGPVRYFKFVLPLLILFILISGLIPKG